MRNKIKRHLGIILLFIMGSVLIFTPGTHFYGFLALVWALCLIRIGVGEENKMKPFEETDTYKELKK